MIDYLAFGIASSLLVVVLALSSREDFRYHRISKKYVLATFFIVIFYNNIVGGSVEATICFLLTLTVFSIITFASKGGFGFGDTLILSAIGWFIGDLIYLQYFFILLVFSMLIFGAYFTIKNRQEKTKIVTTFFKNTSFVNVMDLKAGMTLSNDYFMKGLTEKEIEEYQKLNDDDKMVGIKKAYPFIPVIFLSFLVLVFLILN